jgi:hypothetical protein
MLRSQKEWKRNIDFWWCCDDGEVKNQVFHGHWENNCWAFNNWALELGLRGEVYLCVRCWPKSSARLKADGQNVFFSTKRRWFGWEKLVCPKMPSFFQHRILGWGEEFGARYFEGRGRFLN